MSSGHATERVPCELPGFVYHCQGDDRWATDYLGEGFFVCTGYAPAALTSHAEIAYRDLVHPDDRDAVQQGVRRALAEQRGFELEYRVLLPDLGPRWFADRGCGHYGVEGGVVGLAGWVTDITGRRGALPELNPAERRFRVLFDRSPDAITVIDPEGHLVEINHAALEILGCHDRARVLDCLPADLAPPLQPDGRSSRDAAAAAIAQALDQGEHEFAWLHRRLDNGAAFEAQVHLRRIVLDAQTLLLSRVSDISGRRSDQERLRQLAYEDSLTGLPNRQAALEWLEQILLQDPLTPLLILNLDIDNFQWVNNTFGRVQADQVIRAFAQLLSSQVQPQGMVARLQSDEFLMIIPLARGPGGSRLDHQPDQLLQEIRRSINAGLDDRLDLPYAPTFCIGCRFHEGAIAVNPPHQPVRADEMLQEVNTALSEARRSGVNRQALYVPEMSRMIQKQLQLESRLTQARQLQEFTLHYQPIVRRDGVIVAAEALMRWPQDDGTFIPPGLFIPMLEKSGRIREVGRWLINAACEQLALWRQRQLGLDYLSINISAAQLLSKEAPLHQDLIEAIRCHQLPAAAMQLEITETAVLENIELARLELERVVSSGFSIALDDFGTGYSSLRTLLQLPITGLKIDKTFVDEIDTRPKSFALVEMCVSMAEKLGLRCVAEGIESELQCQQLRKIGCEYFQGYLYDRPLPPEVMEERLLRQHLAA